MTYLFENVYICKISFNCLCSPRNLALCDILFWSPVLIMPWCHQCGEEKQGQPCARCRLRVAMASAPCLQSPWRWILMISVNKAVGGDDQCVRPPPVQGAHSQLPHHCRLPGSGLQLCQRLCNIKILMDQLETA